MQTETTTTTTVSVPSHLHDSLATLLAPNLLPESLLLLLQTHVKPSTDASATEIPYDTLRQISQWAQTEPGRVSLKNNTLNPSDYTMIAMLAGTLSSPSAKLAPYKRPLSPEEEAMVKSKERKAISALLNGFLSTIAVGVAMWWLGGSISMRTDHKVLLSVLGAIAVAVTEGILYWIWQWRYHNALHSQKKLAAVKKKKVDGVGSEVAGDVNATVVTTSALDTAAEGSTRKRRGAATSES
ncbi:hypothetical protein FRB94_007460 [Tulasnella sp. JGI-2019a]|nr:hypothetical protein FRB94_007460 [Tulasnella sp. JGI-2019a]